MAALQGTLVASKIVPTDSQDTFATHEDTYQQGGMRVVSSLADRDAIPNDRRKDGMLVYCLEDDTNYRLFGGITNTDWRNEGQGGNPLSYEPVSAFEYTLKVQINNNDITDLTVEAVYEPQVIFNSDGDIVMAQVQY